VKSFTKDVKPKIFSLIIALILWLHVATEKTYSIKTKVPLVVNFPEDVVLISPIPKNLVIELSGKGKQILKYNLSNDREPYILNPGNLRRGEYTFTIDKRLFRFPEELKVTRVISTPKLEMQFDKKSKKSVRVKPIFKNLPKDGYTKTEEKIKPSQIELSGGRSLLKKVKLVDTEAVDLAEKERPFEIFTKLVLPQGEGFNIEPESVLVGVTIERMVASTYTDLPIKIINRPKYRNVTITPRLIKLVLSGAESDMKSLKKEMIGVELNLKGYTKGEYLLLARIRLPENINLIDASPERFEVRIE